MEDDGGKAEQRKRQEGRTKDGEARVLPLRPCLLVGHDRSVPGARLKAAVMPVRGLLCQGALWITEGSIRDRSLQPV